MKKIIQTLILSSLISSIGIFIFSKFFAEDKLKSIIETKGSQLLSSQVTIDKVHISFWPPISISMDQAHIKKNYPDLDISVPVASFSLDMSDILKTKVIFRILLNEPTLNLNIPEIPAIKNPKETTTRFVLTPSKQTLIVGLNVIIKQGTVTVTKSGNVYSIAKLNGDLLAPTVGVPWDLKFTADIMTISPFKMSIPAKFSSQFLFDGDTIESREVTLELAGVPIQFQGRGSISSGENTWDGVCDIVNLKNYIPKDWSGGLKGAIHIGHVTNTPWRIQGNFTTQGLAIDTEINTPERKIQGQILADSSMDFSYQDFWVLNKLSGSLDLTNLLFFSKEFSKARGLSLKVLINAEGNRDIFNLNQGLLNFGMLSITGRGRMVYGPQGRFVFAGMCSVDDTKRVAVPIELSGITSNSGYQIVGEKIQQFLSGATNCFAVKRGLLGLVGH